MKKMITLLLVFGAAMLFASSVLAADNESNPGSSVTVTDGDTTDPQTLTFKFSPSVVGQYLSNGATANEQWFAICTYHAGGTNFYGTSSSDTLIYNKSRATGETLSDAAIPSTTTAEEGTADDPDTTADETVPSAWDGWSN